MQQQQYFVSCAVILNPDGKILLTKRYNPQNKEVHDKWQLPGGSVDPGEHPKDAAIREVMEETNIAIEILSKRPSVFSHSFNNHVHVVLFVYKAAYTTGILDISGDLEETSDAVWFVPDDIHTLSLLPNTENIILEVLATTD